jgi:competence protein ComGC
MLKDKNNRGFVLITLLIALAIIMIWAAIYFGKSGRQNANTIQTGNKAIEQTKANNNLLLQDQIQTQNELNSIGK